MALLVTSSVQIARFANALYGVKLGSVTNAAVLEDISVVGSSNAFNSYYSSSFGSMTNAAVATTILTNLGLADNTAAKAYVEGQLNAAGSAKGAAVLSMLNAFSNLTSDETFGAAATAWNAKVSAAISYTASNTADVTTDYSASVTSQTFTLTTSVDAVSGGAGNDTISGLVGVSGTFGLGDTIVGGSGTDTLNLLVQSGGQSQVVSLAGVENVNARLLEAGPTSALAVDAIDWAGVTTLSFNNSIDETAVRVSGLTTETTISVQREVDVSVDFRALTSGTDAVSVTLTSAGSGGGTAASLASAGVADIDVDLDNAGLIDTLNVNLAAGTNYATLEAGADVVTLNITGAGNGYLSTDDTLESVDASAAAGNIDITLSGVSDVVVKGGAGNDTLRLGATLTNADSFDGGAGTDRIAATIAGFNRNLNTTNVENATLTFSEAAGGDVNASASTVTGFTFAAGTAGNAASVSQIADGSTITLNDDDLGNVTLDYASGATTTTLNIGSVSGTVAIATLAVTDVATVNINSVGATAGATIGTATFDADVKAISITTSGSEADLTIGTTDTDGSLGGATSLTVTSNGSAAITFNNLDLKGGSTLANVTISANGTDAADVTLGDVSGSAIASIILSAASGADIVVGTLDLGNNSTAGASQDITVSITQGNNSDVTIGAITVTSQGTTTINVTSNGTGGDLDVAAIVLDRAANVTADSAPLNLSFGEVSLGASSTYAINSVDLQNAGTGAQLTFGSVTVGDNADWSAGTISGTATVNVDISSITLTVGSGASADLGAITTTAGAVGAVSVTLLGTDASATFGAVAASAVGTYTIIAGSGAGADFGNIAAFSGENANQGRVGAIEIAGVDAADVTFGTIAASAVGAISVSGALDVTFGTITTTTIGEVNATGLGVSGTFTIDLSGVTNAVEVKLGAGTNTIISGAGNDVITLLAGRTAVAGNDNIQYGTASQGNDNIINFIGGAAASGGDQVEFDVSAFGTGIKDADGSAIAAAESVVFGTASGAAVTLGASANIILFTTAYASTAALITDSADITLATATLTSGDFFAVWTDGTDAYISQIHIEEGASATDGIATLASASGITVTTFATLSNVSAGALVAANFAFV